MSKKKKGPGGRLNRSEIVQARLSPKIRWAAEILARKERRTVSSLIEGLIEKAAAHEIIEVYNHQRGFQNTLYYELPPTRTMQTTLQNFIEYAWSSREPERFVAFAMNFPELLTAEECGMWEFISRNPNFWEHYEKTDNNGENQDSKKYYQALEYSILNMYWAPIYGYFTGKEPIDTVVNNVPMDRKMYRPLPLPICNPILTKLSREEDEVFKIDSDKYR
jgi:hypothetical protein